MVKKVAKGLGVLVVLVLVLAGGYVAYASATAAKRLSFPDVPFPPVTVSKDPAIIERGRYLARGAAHCSHCHSIDDREHPEKIAPDSPLVGGLEFAMGPIGTFHAANLTSDPETGLGALSDGQIARAVRHGVMHDGTMSILMRYAASQPSDEDLGAIISYLRTLPPVKHAVPRGGLAVFGKAILPMFTGLTPRQGPAPVGVQPAAEPTLERGAYLAEHVALCTGCHTPLDMQTLQPTGPKGSGGSVDESHGADKDMEFQPPNLTSDKAGYTGRASEETFLQRMRAGRGITSSIMPWESFKTLTDDDLRSIYRYLKSLPPVRNDLGPSYRKKGSWKPRADLAKT
jgi:mono/diheme cytochrome c family protein